MLTYRAVYLLWPGNVSLETCRKVVGICLVKGKFYNMCVCNSFGKSYIIKLQGGLSLFAVFASYCKTLYPFTLFLFQLVASVFLETKKITFHAIETIFTLF